MGRKSPTLSVTKHFPRKPVRSQQAQRTSCAPGSLAVCQCRKQKADPHSTDRSEVGICLDAGLNAFGAETIFYSGCM